MGCPSGSGLDGYPPQFCVILCSWASKRKESPAFFQSLKVSLRQVQKLTVLICLSTEVKGLEKESMPFYPLRTPLGLCLALFTTKNFSFLMFTEQKVFPCGSGGKETACNAADLGLIPGLGRSPGEGKGYALQYSGLENSIDYIVHGVTKSWTQLRNFHFTSQSKRLHKFIYIFIYRWM